MNGMHHCAEVCLWIQYLGALQPGPQCLFYPKINDFGLSPLLLQETPIPKQCDLGADCTLDKGVLCSNAWEQQIWIGKEVDTQQIMALSNQEAMRQQDPRVLNWAHIELYTHRGKVWEPVADDF